MAEGEGQPEQLVKKQQSERPSQSLLLLFPVGTKQDARFYIHAGGLGWEPGFSLEV